MLTLTRDTKRLTIIVIYIFAFLGMGLGMYMWLRPAATCFDGKQNQNEGGIDCGGICSQMCIENVTGQPLVIEEATAFLAGEGSYDAVMRVTNPNNAVGAKTFRYRLELLDARGQVVGETKGESWVLPQETKTLLAFGVVASESPAKTVLTIEDVTWTKLVNYDIEPKLGVYNQTYLPSSRSGELGGVATGLITNESDYDFRLVTIKVVLRDASGKPLAINQTDRRTFLSGEQHSFRLVWPAPFGGGVSTVEVVADADVYRSDNFLKRYIPASRSQELTPSRSSF